MPRAVLSLLVAGALSSSAAGPGASLGGLVPSTSGVLTLTLARRPVSGAVPFLLAAGLLCGSSTGSGLPVGRLGLLVLGELVEVSA